MRVASLATSRSPIWFRGLNWTGRQIARIGISASLDPERMKRSALRTTGANAFEDRSFEKPLDLLCRSMEEEARLHALGRLFSKIRLTNVLSNRLRAEQYRSEHPDCPSRPSLPPLVITGLQRTGTTFLHRLLAGTGLFHTLHSWEALNPIPLRGDDDKSSKRIALGKQSEQALRLMAPDFFAIHPVEHLAPEEEVLLLDNALLSTVPEATMHVPSYSSWLEVEDQVPAYRHLAKLLALIEHSRSGIPKPWLLKTPHHLEFLEALLEVFPDAVIVQTHRDPHTTLPSFFSMIWHGRRVFSNEVPPEEVGQHWGRKIGRMLDRAMEFRQLSPATPFHDVAYRDLTADPDKVSENILRFVSGVWQGQDSPFGKQESLQLHPQNEAVSWKVLRERLAAVRQQNRANRYGIHRYDLSDFGMDTDILNDWVGRYRDAFAGHITHETS